MKLSLNSVLLIAGVSLGALLLGFFILDSGGARGSARGIEGRGSQVSAHEPEAEQAELTTNLGALPGPEIKREEMLKPKSKRQLAREEKAAKLASEDGPKLYGTILDSNGFGVAGAKVQVSAQGKSKNLFGMIVDNFAKKTTSGVGGNFEVPRSWITNDEVSVKVSARGYEEWEEDREPSEAKGRADLGIIHMQPAVVLGGLVVNASGDPVEGVTVARFKRGADAGGMLFLAMGRGRVHTDVTDAEGRFELAHEQEGEYDLLTKHAGYPQQRFEGSTPEVGREDLSIVIRLDATTSVAGRIAGFPRGMQRIVVQAKPAVRGEDEELRGIALFMPAADAKSPTAKVAADGSFRIEGLAPSKYYVVKALQQKGFMQQVPCSDEAEVLSGALELELTWETAATLSLKVEDAVTGEPIAEGGARFLWQNGTSMMGNMARQRKLKAGHVRIEELRPDPAPGKLQVLIYAPGYKEHKLEAIEIAQGQQLELPTIRLAQAAMLRVRVLDASSGKPLRRAYVELSPIQSSEEKQGDESIINARKSDGNTDRDGWVNLEACMTPTARMIVKKGGFGEYSEAALAMPGTGTQEKEVRLTPAGTVEAYVVDRAGRPVKNSRVYALLADGAHRMEDTNSKGRAKFRSLPPGEHRFRGARHMESTKNVSFSVRREKSYNDEDFSWTSVIVVSKQTSKVNLSVASASSVGGRITAGGRALAKASVRILQQRESQQEMDAEFEMASSMDGGFSGVTSSVKTDSKGSFHLPEVPVGSHTLYVVSQSGTMPHTFPLIVREGDNFVDLELPIASITGRVVDSEGRPVSGASIYARRADVAKDGASAGDLEMIRSMFGRVDQGSVSTNSKGIFVIPNVSPDVSLRIRVSGEGFVSTQSEELSIGKGEMLEGVDLMLSRAGSIRVKLAGASSGFMMATATYAGEEANKPESTTGRGWGGGGVAIIEDLAPGLWRVSTDDLEGAGTLVEVFAGSQAVVNL